MFLYRFLEGGHQVWPAATLTVRDGPTTGVTGTGKNMVHRRDLLCGEETIRAQLFSVHAYVKSDGVVKQLPMTFALMSGRRKKNYERY